MLLLSNKIYKLGEYYMGFEINEEHKIRITLSDYALSTLIEDMEIFGINKISTIINTTFSNFKDEAKASINLYRERRVLELNQLLSHENISESTRNAIISRIFAEEYDEIRNQITRYNKLKGNTKLYHINQENIDFIMNECNDEEEYCYRPGRYLRAIIEEYCELPFIQRERIQKKDVFEKIEKACINHNILKLNITNHASKQQFYVYPYKIVSDPLNTRSYLVCYSRKANSTDNDMIIASFTMARLNAPTVLKATFSLTKSELADINSALSTNSAAYIVGKREKITVKLTDNGKQLYKRKLSSRPRKIDSLSHDDIYVFNCSQYQIFNYFFSFGCEAEIISPRELRQKFIDTHTNALKHYNLKKSNQNKK